MSGEIRIVQGSALDLKLRDNSVDLVVTSPPYFGLRSYKDNGEHYEGQIGSEATPAEFVDALIAATREMVRVLKPSGSIWVNLGDRYMGKAPGPQGETGQRADRSSANEPAKARRGERPRRARLEQFTREDAAWLAGVIDSDGSIGVHINQQPEGRAPSFVPWVRVGQMRSEVVTRIEDVVGTGRVMRDGRGVWHWSASAQQARWVLERVHPWLLIKKRQAWAAIEVARHVEERNARGSHRPLTADDIDYRHGLRNAVMAWNRGDDYDLDPPEPPAVSLPIYPLAPRDKSLCDIPHAYAAACVGRLGLILRAEVIWSKTNGMPESVTDRVRRSHETWFHFTKSERYFSAIDEVREPHTDTSQHAATRRARTDSRMEAAGAGMTSTNNPLGRLPGSVWTIPTQPLRIPDHISHARCCGGVKRDGCKDGINHFAAFPMEWPKRIITGWSPAGICANCGFMLGSTYDKGMLGVRDIVRGRSQGPAQDVLFQDVRESPHGAQSGHDEGLDADEQGVRGDACAGSPDGRQDGLRNAAPSSGRGGAGTRPPALGSRAPHQRREGRQPAGELGAAGEGGSRQAVRGDAAIPDRVPVLRSRGAVTGECPHCGSTETRQSVICDPFGGTGTTALVASVLGRRAISVDLSGDYCSIARWRTTDPKQIERARR